MSLINTEDEWHTDLSTWTSSERKKLQHMTVFHEEYQWVFGEKASIHTIMKQGISHMSPPIPKSICEEEIQNASLDTNEVIVEYITDAHGNKVKSAVPKNNFMQKREITVDSYSETISSEESSDERTITAEGDSSATSDFEETPCKWEADSKGIEATLHQISFGTMKCCRRISNTSFSNIKISTI